MTENSKLLVQVIMNKMRNEQRQRNIRGEKTLESAIYVIDNLDKLRI